MNEGPEKADVERAVTQNLQAVPKDGASATVAMEVDGDMPDPSDVDALVKWAKAKKARTS